MKHNFKFLTLSRVFNDCRDSVGRLSTLILLLFALSFGFNQEVKADPSTGYSINYPYIYFLNNDNWSQCGVLYGRKWGNNDSESYTNMQNMTKVSNTEKLYYAEVTSYWNNTYNQIAIVAANGWGGINQHIEARYNGVSHTGVYYNYTMNYHNTYYITSTGSTNIDISYKSGGYGGIPKTTAKIQVQTRNSTGDYTTLTSETAPATVTLQGTHMSGNGETGRNTVTWDGEKEYNVVITGKVTTSYSSMDSKYQFDGWYVGSTNQGTGTSYDYYQSSATTVIAKFTRIKYTVTLDADGGTGGTTSVTATYNEAMPTISSSNFPTRTGFTFDGYYTGKNGTGTKYYNADGTSAKTCDLTDNITLYAKWAVVLTVSKGTGISSVSESVNPASLDGQYNISAIAANGYNFNQWTASPAANAVFENSASASTKVTIKNGSVTVTATATEIMHTVSVASNDGNKGTVSTASVSGVGIATKSGEITATPRAGYYFTGWDIPDGVTLAQGYTQQSTTIKINATADGITITANFAPRFYLRGSVTASGEAPGGMPGWNDDAKESGKGLFSSINGTTATITKTLEAGTTYKLKLGDLQGDYSWGASSAYELTNNADLWTFTSHENNCPAPTFKTAIAGTYTFTIDFSGASPKMKITYPDVSDFALTVAKERVYNETPIANFIAGNGTEASPYQFYLDEKMTLTVTALSAVTGVTAYYKFGDDEESSTVLTKDITAANTTVQSIVVKTYYKGNIGSYTSAEKTETIYYQGVACPQLFLTSNLTNDETELDQAPENVTISYTTTNYTGTTTITKNGGAWQTATGTDQHYTEPLTKSIHADTYVATATPNGRTFTTSLVVSVYRYVQVKVKDADPKWAKNVYMWKSGTDKKNADWPGVALTTQLGDWYIFAVKYPTYDYFVINDGKETGKQTIDLTIPAENICYEIGTKKEEKESKEIYNCESGECPNGLYVGDIANVEMYNGESTTVSPVVQLDPSLSEDNLHINFSYSNGGIVNAAQSGKNIMLSATSTGTTTVTATYSIDGAQSVNKTFSVTVTGSVLIQISVDQSYDWTDHGAIYIKYFNHGYDSQKNLKWDHYSGTQDYYSARIPLGSDNKIDFMVYAWKIENEHKDHQTTNVTDVTTDGCYFVSNDFYDGKRGIGSNGSGLCWEDYQVKIVMGNGTTYYSNKVNNLNEIVSFYAPADNEQGYKHGNVYLTHNGVQVAPITGFAESNVYTAKVADNGLTDINVYDGPFYIRTNATSWDDYKKADYQMNEFSLYNGAQYNYYWVGNHKSSGNFNINGCVANQYNESLANTIETDTYTDEYGNIQNDPTLGVNLRFGYNPQTNHFERSILKGSSDNEFLNVIGDNIYNEFGCTTQLNQQDANSKFSDMSNWVYEKVVYANIGGGFTEAPVKLLSKAFNGTVVYQFGYTIDPNTGQKTSTPATRSIMATGTTTGTYQLRLIYDYKTNRLTAAWSPADNQLIENSITVNADIMFMQKEHNDATRLLMGENGKVESLEYLLFILQIMKDDTRSGSNNNFEHYYISLPYDCMIQDIYGIEGFGEYWGIQKYDGAERARKGWFIEDTPEGFWKWMKRDEKLNGGEGYLLSVAKGWLNEDNKFSTIEDTDGEEISALRLYFPSYTKGYDLSKSSANESKEYPQQRCEITSPVDRRKEDSNWRMIGSTAYNDIKTETVFGSADDDHKLAASYLYELQEIDHVWKYVPVPGENYTYKAFQGYMYQFEGSINWQRYTKGEEEQHPASAPHYEAKRPAEKMRLSVMENNMEVAHTFVELNENATKEFDFNLDLAYLASGDMDLYTEIENAHLAANVTDYESQMIALHVDPTHYNTYTFHLDGANNVAVYLLDNMNGTCQLLSAGDVTVELEEGSSGDRFALRFDVAAVPTDIKNAKGETIVNDGQKTQKLLINGNIYLINGGRVYNATGAELR